MEEIIPEDSLPLTPPPILSLDVVKALTSEIISDRPHSSTSSPSPYSPSAAAAAAGAPNSLKLSRDSSGSQHKKSTTSTSSSAAISSSHSKKLHDDPIAKTPSRRKVDSPLVSSRGSGTNTEIEGGSELDSFLKRKKENSTGAVGGIKKTTR